MTRAAAKVHVDDAITDVESAMADAPKSDPLHQMLRDIKARMTYLLTRLRD